MADAQSPRSTADPPRRNFVTAAAAVVVGTVSGAFSFLCGLWVFLDPLTRKPQVPVFYRESGEGGGHEGVRVASLDAVPDDGVPRRFPVIDDKIDAWNFSPDEPIGAVYIVRENGKKEVTVFHATCPHAGCSVSYRHNSDPSQCAFHCPCHNSAFNLDGTKINIPGAENPSPRDLDELKAQIDESTGDIWVDYRDYYTGIHEQKPKL